MIDYSPLLARLAARSRNDEPIGRAVYRETGNGGWWNALDNGDEPADMPLWTDARARTSGWTTTHAIRARDPSPCNSSAVARVLVGSEVEMVESFEAYVEARMGALLKYGFVLTGDQHDAADLTQEALARLGARWAPVSAKGDPEGYVRTTMARLHISWWRRGRREHPVRALPERGYTDEGLARADGDVGLWHAVKALPNRQRVVLVLRYYEQLDDDEIARILGISRGTVRSQAARGLDKLRGTAAARIDEPTTRR